MNRLARYIIIGVSVGAVAFLLWYFSSIVWYIVVATVLSLIGKPIVELLSRWLPRWVGATVALMAMWAFFVGMCWGMVPLFSGQLSDLQSIDPTELLQRFDVPLEQIDLRVQRFLPSEGADFSIKQEIRTYMAKFVNATAFTNLFASTANFVTDLLIFLFSVSFITFFFLKDEQLFANGLSFFFPERYEDNVRHAMARVNALLRRYFVGIIVESLVITILTTPLLLLLRIPWNTAIVIGLLSGVLNVIPYVGALISLGIAYLLPLMLYIHGPGPMPLGTLLLLITAVFLAVRFVDNFFLQPYIYSSSASAHPLEIFLVLLLAGSVAGVVGMLLAIPAYIVVRVFAKEFFNNFHLVQRLTKNI